MTPLRRRRRRELRRALSLWDLVFYDRPDPAHGADAPELPFIIGGVTNSTYIFSGQRTNNNATSARIAGGTTDQRIALWFDTTVFSQPPAYTFGTRVAPCPTFAYPGQFNHDVSLFKNTRFGRDGRITLQYRLEALNAFNTPQFSGAGNGLLANNFGVISSTAVSPRQVQMALQLLW